MIGFEKKRNRKGEWIWTFYGQNGEAIAKSTESHKREAVADRSIEIMRTEAPDAEIFTRVKK